MPAPASAANITVVYVLISSTSSWGKAGYQTNERPQHGEIKEQRPFAAAGADIDPARAR